METNAVAFRVAQDDLNQAVSAVARNLPTKAVQPVLRAMVITAGEDGLEFVGFDTERSTRVTISADVASPGRVAVAGKLIADITRQLPNQEVDFQVEKNALVMRCGSARFALPLISLDDYPRVPALPETTGTIDPAEFQQAVMQVASAAGSDETLPMLTGVNMEIHGGVITLAATDRFRLAQRRLQWQPLDPQVEAKLLVPAQTLMDSARALDTHMTDPVQVAIGSAEKIGSDGLFGLEIDNQKTTTRLLDSEFPNIAPLLPKEHNALAVVEIAPLQETLRRVALVADRSAQIRMQFAEGMLTISASGSDSGQAEESLACEYFGAEPLMIAFNAGYLGAGLKVMNTDKVVFGFTESTRPAILAPLPEVMPELGPSNTYPTPATDFVYLLMPVRLPG